MPGAIGCVNPAVENPPSDYASWKNEATSYYFLNKIACTTMLSGPVFGCRRQINAYRTPPDRRPIWLSRPLMRSASAALVIDAKGADPSATKPAGRGMEILLHARQALRLDTLAQLTIHRSATPV